MTTKSGKTNESDQVTWLGDFPSRVKFLSLKLWNQFVIYDQQVVHPTNLSIHNLFVLPIVILPSQLATGGILVGSILGRHGHTQTQMDLDLIINWTQTVNLVVDWELTRTGPIKGPTPIFSGQIVKLAG